MTTRTKIVSLVVLFLVITGAQTVLGADFTVTITNTTYGAYFTPFLITAHSDSEHIFTPGEEAGDELQAMAEGGDISGLETMVGGADADTIVNPAGGLLAPGSSLSADLNTDASGNTALSLVAMILPTNDGFVGLDALDIPQEPGTYVHFLAAYDAGTEPNDELVVGMAGGAPGTPGIPAEPGGNAGMNGTGVTDEEDNTTVHIHRGVLGDADPFGGLSDLDSASHRWLNPVAKLVIVVN